jgi:hypothetical protein
VTLARCSAAFSSIAATLSSTAWSSVIVSTGAGIGSGVMPLMVYSRHSASAVVMTRPSTRSKTPTRRNS